MADGSVARDVAHDVAIVALAVVLACNGILVAVARLDARRAGLLAHQGTHDDARHEVEIDRTLLDEAVAQHTLATQLAGNGSYAGGSTVGLERAVLDAETLDGAQNVVEEADVFFLIIVAHVDVPDHIAAAVVVALEARSTGADGHHQRVAHVDVGSLQHMEVAAAHLSDGDDELLQVFGRANLIGVLCRAIAQLAQLLAVVRIDIVNLEHHGMVVLKHGGQVGIAALVEVLEPDGVGVIDTTVQPVRDRPAGQDVGVLAGVAVGDCAMVRLAVHQRFAIGIAPHERSAGVKHLGADRSHRGSTDRVIISKTVADNSIAEHAGNDASGNTCLFVADYLAILHEAVGDFAVAAQASGNTTYTCAITLTFDCHSLDSKMGHLTCHFTEDTHTDTPTNITVTDGVTVTVVDTFENMAVSIANRSHKTATTINIGCLSEMDAEASIAIITVFSQFRQFIHATDEEGFFSRSLTGEYSEGTHHAIGVFVVVAIHLRAGCVEHGMGIAMASLDVDVLTPGNTER